MGPMGRALVLLALALAGPGPVSWPQSVLASHGQDNTCQPDKLTVYKIVMHTFWSRDRFPKHYPDWRPPAQWSKVIGKLPQRVRIRVYLTLCFPNRADP